MRKHLALVATCLVAAGTVPAAAAENCQLKMVASVDTETDRFGAMLLPANFGGQRKYLLVDTGGVFHMLKPGVVKELGLPVRESAIGLTDVLANTTRQVARAPAFSIGAMTPASVDFVVMPEDQLLGGDDIAGIFFPGVYRRSLDVDLDFAGRKFSLFLQDHCPGAVVYWPNSGVAVVPIRFNGTHIAVPVSVDGNELLAEIDTGASETTMYTRAARRLGVDVDAGQATEAGQVGNNRRVRRYEHRFRTLSIAGITVSNPLIALIPDLNTQMPGGPSAAANDTRLGQRRSEGPADMLVGMSILRHLHMYIAYEEEKLYITAGAAPAAATAAPDTAPTKH